MINPGNPMSQNKNGSPAQIMADVMDLADVIFGTNSGARIWARMYAALNELEYCDCALGVHVSGTPAPSDAVDHYTPTPTLLNFLESH